MVVRIILWILAIQVIELLAFLFVITVWPQAVSSPLRDGIIVANMLIGNAATISAFWKAKTKQPQRHDYFVVAIVILATAMLITVIAISAFVRQFSAPPLIANAVHNYRPITIACLFTIIGLSDLVIMGQAIWRDSVDKRRARIGDEQ